MIDLLRKHRARILIGVALLLTFVWVYLTLQILLEIFWSTE